MSRLRHHQREQALLRVLRRLDRFTHHGQEASQQFSRWRLGVFLTGAALCLGFYQHAWFHAGNLLLVLFLAGFLTISFFHQRLKSRLHRLAMWRDLKQTNLARHRLDWENIPEVINHSTPPNHPYALDLDLTGPHSLLTLLDTTFSSNGRKKLEHWIFHTQSPTAHSLEWPRRQALVKELTPLARLRDRCRLATRLIGPEPLDSSRIAPLIEQPSGIPSLSWIIPVSFLLTGLTLSLGMWTLLSGAPNWWLITLILYAGLYFMLSGRITPLFGRVLTLQTELEKLVSVMGILEKTNLTTCHTIQQVCAPLLQTSVRPSSSLRQLSRICQGLSVKAHPLIHIGLNLLTPWDLWFVSRLDRLLQQLRHRLPDWLESIGNFDSAGALAHFAYLNPDYVWPSLNVPEDPEPHPGLKATRMGHPLIPHDRRVTNDLDLHGEGHLVLITGSNMSGKSTFLRTVGINVCLAQAGGPVCAEQFAWTWVRLYCCIRVTDALDQGLSYFYAEVKRLKVILDAVQEPNPIPVLFLIDEIYRGTNNRERLAGSEAFIQALQTSRGLGLLSTHDLELANLADTNGHIRNAHFQETVQEGSLHFDYQLRPGPCPTTNALRIMAQEGLPVPAKDIKSKK